MTWDEKAELIAFGVFSIWADDLFWLFIKFCRHRYLSRKESPLDHED